MGRGHQNPADRDRLIREEQERQRRRARAAREAQAAKEAQKKPPKPPEQRTQRPHPPQKPENTPTRPNMPPGKGIVQEQSDKPTPQGRGAEDHITADVRGRTPQPNRPGQQPPGQQQPPRGANQRNSPQAPGQELPRAPEPLWQQMIQPPGTRGNQPPLTPQEEVREKKRIKQRIEQGLADDAERQRNKPPKLPTPPKPGQELADNIVLNYVEDTFARVAQNPFGTAALALNPLGMVGATTTSLLSGARAIGSQANPQPGQRQQGQPQPNQPQPQPGQPQATPQQPQPLNPLDPLGLVRNLTNPGLGGTFGTGALGLLPNVTPPSGQWLNHALGFGRQLATGSAFNPTQLATTLAGGHQTVNPTQLANTLTTNAQAPQPQTNWAQNILNFGQNLQNNAQNFMISATGKGAELWNNAQNWDAQGQALIRQMQVNSANQVLQGQQQGGIGGFFQQALGHTGGALASWNFTSREMGSAAWNTIRNWDTQAYIREAQTFYNGQIQQGQQQGGIGGFFQQAGGYLGNGLTSLPGLATQISPFIDGAVDWAGQQRQNLYGAINHQLKDVPFLQEQAQRVFGVTEFFAQYSGGTLKGAGSMVGGIAQMITNPVDTLKGLYTMGENLPTLPGMPNTFRMLSATTDVVFNGADPQQRFESVFNQNVVNQQMGQFWGNAANSFWQPYQESINAGKPMEAVGRGVFEVVSNVLGGGSGVAGKAGKVSRVADLAGDMSQVGRVANVAGDMSQASRVGRVAGAMENLGGFGGLLQRGRGALGGMFDNAGGLLQRGRGAIGGMFDNAGGLLQRGRGAIGGMFDNAGGLLQRGRQAAGGVFDNIVGLPKRFREMGNNPTLQAALQRGRGVFADIKAAGRGLMDEFGPQPSLRRMLGDDLVGRGYGLGDLWKDVKGFGGDIRDWLSGKPRQPDLVTPEGVRIPASQLDDVPPANTMAMSADDVPGTRGKPAGSEVPETSGSTPQPSPNGKGKTNKSQNQQQPTPVQEGPRTVASTWNEFQAANAGKFKSKAEAATAWKVYQESASASQTLVIGRLPDTAAAELAGFQRLNTKGWTPAVNDAWVQGAIDSGKPLKLVSPISRGTLTTPPGSAFPSTIFRRELHQLQNAGYTIRGGWALPPGS